MKKIVISFIICSFFSSCKNDPKKEEIKEDSKVKIEQVVEKKKSVTLEDHLLSGLEDMENREDVEFVLTNDLTVKGFGMFERKKDNYVLILKLQDDITPSVVEKYTFTVEAFVYDEDLDKLSAYSKKKKRKNEAWVFKPQLKEFNGNKYVLYTVNTPIVDFQKLRFYVFDREGFKGTVGQKGLFQEYSVK